MCQVSPGIDEPQPGPPLGPRRSGIVVPRKLKWQQRWMASLIYGLIEAVSFTIRYEWHFHSELLALPAGAPVIFCIWHNRLPFSLIMYRHYVHRRQQPPRLAALVSASKDGGVVARILEHFGVQPVRGSSSRRGPQALLELTRWAERGYDLAITPDGPRGPRYVVQPGAIALAQVTGLPVVPASYYLAWKIRMKSWDGFQMPVPFSRAVMKFGQPVRVPRDARTAEREALRLEVEDRMKVLMVD